jgi:hypothetical protein
MNISINNGLQMFCNCIPLGYTIIIHMQKILRETQSNHGTWKELHQNPTKGLVTLMKDLGISIEEEKTFS